MAKSYHTLFIKSLHAVSTKLADSIFDIIGTAYIPVRGLKSKSEDSTATSTPNIRDMESRPVLELGPEYSGQKLADSGASDRRKGRLCCHRVIVKGETIPPSLGFSSIFSLACGNCLAFCIHLRTLTIFF